MHTPTPTPVSFCESLGKIKIRNEEEVLHRSKIKRSEIKARAITLPKITKLQKPDMRCDT